MRKIFTTCYPHLVIIIGLMILMGLLNSLSIHYADVFFDYYTAYLYKPLQYLKGLLWQDVVINLGDITYLLLLVIALAGFIRLIKRFTKINADSLQFVKETLRFVRLLTLIYSVFFLAWGINYNRPKVAGAIFKPSVKVSQMGMDTLAESKSLRLPVDTLLQFGLELADEMKALEADVNLDTLNWMVLNKMAKELYGNLQNQYTVVSNIKKASLGTWLNKFGIQGYFNPLTGEGQVIGNLPAKLKPFVILHEMAHQVGIASEGDANLLAVLVSLSSANKGFQYAGLFNAYLYLKNELRYRDSLQLPVLEARESVIMKQDIAAIQAYRKLYRSEFRFISLGAYDSFLKYFGQKQGIKSYSSVTLNFYQYRKCNLDIYVLFDHL